MNWIVTIYTAFLFFILTPGVLVTLPPKSKKMIVIGTHAAIFALIFHFTHHIVWKMSNNFEGFREGNTSTKRIKPTQTNRIKPTRTNRIKPTRTK